MQSESDKPCRYCGNMGEGMPSPEAIAHIAAETPIDPAMQSVPSLYEARLKQCEACEALREQVLCAFCGCFVMFRARIAKAYCPNPGKDRWMDL